MNYHPKLIEFFQNHNLYNEDMFNYFMNNTGMVDYNYEEQRIFIGCSFLCTDHILKRMRITLPYLEDNKTMLISVHELVHAITAFKYLYRRVTPKVKSIIKDESLPLLYEKVYIAESGDEKLNGYLSYLDSKIDETSPIEYQNAIKIREELYQNYHPDFDMMTRLSKKLIKKINR